MALQGPEAAATDDGDDAPIFSEINITPLTDVILVLLIIFMVSSSAMVDAAREGRLDVALPSAGSATAEAPPAATLVIGVTAAGDLFVHGRPVDTAALERALAEAHARAPDTVVIVDADNHLEHGQVVAIIDRVRAAGFVSVGIGAESP